LKLYAKYDLQPVFKNNPTDQKFCSLGLMIDLRYVEKNIHLTPTMIKRILLIITLFFTFSLSTEAQETVEKSVSGVQVGFLGAWVHHEARLADQFALRTEIGLDASGFISNPFTEAARYAFVPEFTIEPRYYYNISKRAEKQKNTTAN